MKSQPPKWYNRSVTHNLMKRSLGCPYHFHITNSSSSRLPSAPPPLFRTSRVARLPYKQYQKNICVKDIDDDSTGSWMGRPSPLGSYNSLRLAMSMRPVPADVSFNKLLLTDRLHPLPLTMPFSNDKVFSSVWLDDNQVLLGTKCHKLLVYNVFKQQFVNIDTLSGGDSSNHPEGCCGGMRAIAVNPSRTLVATCGRDCSTVAVYSLPTMTPLVVTKGAHYGWIFDLSWINDTNLAVACRDGCMTIWDFATHYNKMLQKEFPAWSPTNSSIVTEFDKTSINNVNSINSSYDNDGIDIRTDDRLSYEVTSKFKTIIDCGSKVRAVECHEKNNVVALTTNGKMLFFDANHLSVKQQILKIPGGGDNICLAYDTIRKLYAVGSRSETLLVDNRAKHATVMIVPLPSSDTARFVRSLCFSDNILSIGTGTGDLYFLDVRSWRNKFVTYYGNHFSTTDMSRTHSITRNSRNYYAEVPTTPNDVYYQNRFVYDDFIDNYTRRAHDHYNATAETPIDFNQRNTERHREEFNSNYLHGVLDYNHSYMERAVELGGIRSSLSTDPVNDPAYSVLNIRSLRNALIADTMDLDLQVFRGSWPVRGGMRRSQPPLVQIVRRDASVTKVTRNVQTNCSELVGDNLSDRIKKSISNGNSRLDVNHVVEDRHFLVSHDTSRLHEYPPFYDDYPENGGRSSPDAADQLAIYTHCFNESKSMIFAAGGSLSAYQNNSFCTLYA